MNCKLRCRKLYEDETYDWFSAMRFNGFYRVEKATEKAELLFHFPEENLEKENMFYDMVKVGDWFIFAPMTGKHIVLYHEKKKQVKTIPLKEEFIETLIKYAKEFKFISIAVVGTNVFFIPTLYPAIVKLDLKTMTLTYLEDWIAQVEVLPEFTKNASRKAYFFTSLVVDTQIYLPLVCSPHVIIMDGNTGAIKIEEVNGTVDGFKGIAFDGTNFWLTPSIGDCVTKWNPESKEVLSIQLSERAQQTPLIYNPVIYQDTLYIPCGLDGIPFEINIKTGAFKESALLTTVSQVESELYDEKYADMFCISLKGNCLRFISGKNSDWYRMNLDTGEVSHEPVFIEEQGLNILKRKTLLYGEKRTFGLKEFVNLMNSQESSAKEKEKAKQTVGEAILKATT